MTRILAIPFLWLASVAGVSSAEGTVTLRTVVRVEAGAVLTLGTVAVLEGAEATALAGVVIEGRADAVTIEEVRDAIDGTGSVNWGRLSLVGSRCRVVRVVPSVPARAEGPGPRRPTAEAREHRAGSVGSLVLPRIAEALEIPSERLRLDLEESGADGSILELATAGRTIDIRPVGASDRLPIGITVYEGDRLIARGMVRARAMVEREVCVSRGPIARGERIGAETFVAERRWLPLSARVLAPGEAIGRIARSRIGADEVISLQDAALPVAIGKGDQAVIHCISGSVILKLRARAMSDGAAGDVIEFTGLDGKKGRVIRARVEGPGVAIATTEGADGAP